MIYNIKIKKHMRNVKIYTIVKKMNTKKNNFITAIFMKAFSGKKKDGEY